MCALGHRRTATECRSKTKCLRQEYNRVVMHNKRTGVLPATCPYYRELNRILKAGAEIRPRRVARNLRLTHVKQGETLPQQPAVVEVDPSEELFNVDLITIGGEDIHPQRYSTPFNAHAHVSPPPAALSDNQSLIQEPETQEDPGSSSTQIERGAEISPGMFDDLAALHGQQDEGDMEEAPRGVPEPKELEEDPNTGVPLGGLSAEERLQRERTRLRRVSVLTAVGERLLEQGREDQQEARHLAATMMRMEREHFRLGLEESRKDREEARLDREERRREWQDFRESMSRNSGALQCAVQTLREMVDILKDMRPQGSPPEDTKPVPREPSPPAATSHQENPPGPSGVLPEAGKTRRRRTDSKAGKAPSNGQEGDMDALPKRSCKGKPREFFEP
ncbi:uncharacterized protein LOC143831644 isoform X2 [Paroedura picta]